MSRIRESRARGSRGHDKETAPIASKQLMPLLDAPRITTENLFSPDRGLTVITSSPLPEDESGGGVVDLSLIARHGAFYRYEWPVGYPKHFSLDKYLFPFIQHFIPEDMDEDDGYLMAECIQLERAMLVGQDSMLGCCGTSYPSFPMGMVLQTQFPAASQLGFFSSEIGCPTPLRSFSFIT